MAFDIDDEIDRAYKEIDRALANGDEGNAEAWARRLDELTAAKNKEGSSFGIAKRGF